MERYSQSRLKTFDNCKLKYKLTYKDKIKIKKPPQPDTEFGNFIHKAAELWNGTLESRDLIKDSKHMYKLDEYFNSIVKSTLNNYVRFYNKYKDYKCLNEQSYELIIKDKYWLYVKLDKILSDNNEIILADLKTSKSYNRDWYHFQLKFYTYVYCKVNDVSKHKVKSLLYNPRIPYEDLWAYDLNGLDKFENEIIEKIDLIEGNNDWSCNFNFMCKYCDYENTEYCRKDLNEPVL